MTCWFWLNSSVRPTPSSSRNSPKVSLASAARPLGRAALLLSPLQAIWKASLDGRSNYETLCPLSLFSAGSSSVWLLPGTYVVRRGSVSFPGGATAAQTLSGLLHRTLHTIMPMRIRLTSVAIGHYEKALKFYTEVLGFVKKRDVPLGHGTRWITVVSPEEPEGTELLLEPNAGYPPLKALKEALVKDGIPFTA